MINLQRVGEAVIPDGAIDTNHLANDAVTSEKMANGSVIEGKIADLAIATGKLQDNAITLAKADRTLNLHHLLTDDSEVSHEGTVETAVKEFKFVKSSDAQKGFAPKYLATQLMMKTSAAAKQASIKFYIDEEGSARITLNSVSESYELLSENVDITDLENGTHTVTVKLVNADAAGISYNQLLSAFLEK